MMSELLTVSDAARLAGVSVRTLRRQIARGQVTAIGRGHDRRVVAASLSSPAASSRLVSADQGHPADTPADRRTSGQADMAAVIEAGHLAAMVDRLTAQLVEQTAVAAMWQERARVLGEQLALQAPSESAVASNLAPETPDPTPGPPSPFPWPLPPSPNIRPLVVALFGLVVLAVLLVAGVVLLVLR